MGIVYRKTEKGQAEIAIRFFRLAPRLRSALILVDGKRDADELTKIIPPPAEGVLDALRNDGFIEATGEVEPAVAAPQPVAAEAPQAAPAVAGYSLDESRRRAVRWISDRLGPHGDPLAMRIEKTKTPDDLRAALALADNFVKQQLGAARSQEFRQHVGLPPG